MAYPKQKPDKVSKSAGISLPADMIESLARAGQKRGKTKSALAREIFKNWLQKSGESLEAAAKPKLEKAKSSVKKRR